MAERISNPYHELFESLTIPERLEPENIAAMLDERFAQSKISSEKKSPEIKISETEKRVPAEKTEREYPREITVSGKHRVSAVYRSLASLAACAAMVFGVLAYMGYADIPAADSSEPHDGGAFASDYDDVHKTFEKYYVNSPDSKTLDSAIADIEHSYADNENNSSQNSVDTPDDTSADPTVEPDAPVGDSTVPTPAEPVPDEPPAATEPETPAETPVEKPSGLPIPEKGASADNSDILFGDGFILRRDENIIRVISNSSGSISYTGNIFPSVAQGSTKTLAGFFASGRRVVTVYSVVNEQTPIDGLLDSLYADSAKNRSEVEVCTYEISGAGASLISTTVLSGSLVDMNFSNGSLYLITAYSDYRNAPIVGVDDLESYVPSYTVDGIKYYVPAVDIMIPDYISNTDYTVISGINLSGGVSVKAVLGYEGRVILRSNAVYLMSYDSTGGADRTTVRAFGLIDGSVADAGYVDIDGIALSGDGVSVFGSTIALTAVRRNAEGGYTTTLGLYDGTMTLISYVDFPGALTGAERIGNTLWLSGAKIRYGVDLSDPAHPVLLDEELPKDPGEGLMAFGDGYVTLTKVADGSLVLAKLSGNGAGGLKLDFETTVCSEKDADSAALENNGLLFISGDVVGLPYSFFDGYDYCCRYALFSAKDGGFAPMGEIERHETDRIYEYEKAVLNGGVLYIFSEGRVTSAVVGESLSARATADIVPSAYSGH